MDDKLGLTIRKAYIDDADFLARRVLDAVGITEPSAEELSQVSHLCSLDYTLFSWRNSMIAEVEGERAGVLVSYPGTEYAAMRHNTFTIVKAESGKDFFGMDMETEPGEYYIDSLSVVEGFRKRGIGRQLLQLGIDEARRLGIEKVTLACEPHNEKAFAMYSSFGFVREGDVNLYGDDYWKMALKVQELQK